MQRMKIFLFGSLGVLALAIAFHLGVQSALSVMEAKQRVPEGAEEPNPQGPKRKVIAAVQSRQCLLITENGDVWAWDDATAVQKPNIFDLSQYPSNYRGNVFTQHPQF